MVILNRVFVCMSKKKLICGVGINDLPYTKINRVELPRERGGKRKRKIVWECPYYKRWVNMIYRCYSGVHIPYKSCIVSQPWLTFSNFRKWMVTQDWEGSTLDSFSENGTMYPHYGYLSIEDIQVLYASTLKLVEEV